MSGLRSADVVEWAADLGAASVLGAAAWYASTSLLGTAAPAPAAAALALIALRRVQPAGKQLPVPAFATADLALEDAPEELLLEDRLVPEDADGSQDAAELLLDDILAELEPDSRVVRLFEPRRVPTAGDLHRSIDRHLHRRNGMVPPPDASQALSDALAELRRSLR